MICYHDGPTRRRAVASAPLKGHRAKCQQSQCSVAWWCVVALLFISVTGLPILSSSITFTRAANTAAEVASYPALDVALPYSFSEVNLALLLTQDGVLHAHDIVEGESRWTIDLEGGPVASVKVVEAPTEETAAQDPLAQPFFVRGNSLYTRIPFPPMQRGASSESGGSAEGSPSSFFFMNISTLLRRQTVMVGETDIYVTTSATVVDVDGISGRYLSMGNRQASNAMAEAGATVASPALGPLLHIIRYNVVIHAYKPGAYRWSITLSQLRLSERSATMEWADRPPYYPSSANGQDGENSEEENPRFFSHLMQDMLEYDHLHKPAAEHLNASVGGEGLGNRWDAADESVPLRLRRTRGAKLLSRFLYAYQENETHVSLRTSQRYEGVPATWRVRLSGYSSPPVPLASWASVQGASEPSTVVAAYLWLGGSRQVLRIPVGQQPVGNELTKLSEGVNGSKATDVRSLLPFYSSELGPLVPLYNGHKDLVALPYMEKQWLEDIDAEEREGHALEAYFHQCSWWEDPLLQANWHSGGNHVRGYYSHRIAQDGNSAASSSTSLPFYASDQIGPTGLAWRTAAVISFHVVCLAGSIAFLCAGVPPRGRLQRAWAQADRNRDRISLPMSLPPSARLLPQDLISPAATSHCFSIDNSTGHGEDLLPVAARFNSRLLESDDSVKVGSASVSLDPTTAEQLFEFMNDGGTQTIEGGEVEQGSTSDNSEDDHDEESTDIGLGERWWIRSSRWRSQPSLTTNDDSVSDQGSSSSHFRAASAGNQEEGRLFQQHFKVLEKIGFGGEGSVFCVEHRVTHARYAIKAIQIHEQDEERVVQEAVLHSSFDNANVVRFYFCWIEDISVSMADDLQLCNRDDGYDTFSQTFSDHSMPTSASGVLDSYGGGTDSSTNAPIDAYHMLFIQMEYFARGTLADWLRTRKGFYRLDVLQYIKQVAEGLEYLHHQDVVHRDLKPTNIFVSNDNILKIGDFGLAKRRDPASGAPDLASNVLGGHQEQSVVGGSPLYCSPEQRRGEVVHKPSDVFSLGVIAVEMFSSFNTLHERIRTLTDAHQQVLPAELKEEFAEEADLVTQMLNPDPQRRPTIRKVLRILRKLIFHLEEEQSEKDVEDGPGSPLDAHPSLSTHFKTNIKQEYSQLPLYHHVPLLPVDAVEVEEAVSTTFAVAAVATSPLPSPAPLYPNGTQSAAAPLPSLRQASRGSITSSTALGRSRNSYHERPSLNCSAAPQSVESTMNASSTAEMSSQTQSTVLPTSLVTDPYGLPTTPVTYSGDADLTTILKRDFHDRSGPPPD